MRGWVGRTFDRDLALALLLDEERDLREQKRRSSLRIHVREVWERRSGRGREPWEGCELPREMSSVGGRLRFRLDDDRTTESRRREERLIFSLSGTVDFGREGLRSCEAGEVDFLGSQICTKRIRTGQISDASLSSRWK